MAHIDQANKKFVLEDQDYSNLIQMFWLLNMVKEQRFGQATFTLTLHEGIIQDAVVQQFVKQKFNSKEISTLTKGLTASFE